MGLYHPRGLIPTMIGAYSSGAKPIVTASGFKLVGTTAIVDLAVTGSGGGNAFDTSSSVGGLLLRMTGTGSVSNQLDLHGRECVHHR